MTMKWFAANVPAFRPVLLPVFRPIFLATVLTGALWSSPAVAQAPAPTAQQPYPDQQQQPAQQNPSPPAAQQPNPQQQYPQQQPPYPQQPYPQQQYPQQQPPYPQQPYPQQQYPQQPYPQQPYSQQQYPQQPYPQQPYPQQYPPPGYPPPGYRPPPRPRRHSFVLLGYLGVQSYQGSASSDSFEGTPTDLRLDTGLRLGGLFGFHVGPQISLNAELTLDIPNAAVPQDAFGDSTDITAVRFSLSFSPLYHIEQGNLEIVVGPKLGLWATQFSAANDFANNGDLTYSGWLLGLNAGVFYRLGRVGLGGLVSFDYDHVSSACENANDGSQNCDHSSTYSSDKILSFNLAILL
jgi:hypothetical protein